MRDRPLLFLPALFAALMLAGTAPARAGAALTMALCAGGSAPVPGQPRRQDCDQACHAGCGRRAGAALTLPASPTGR
ncbi:MAG: hypothetical protein ACOYLS_16495 [Polymorphobacter sp.]